MSTGIEIFKKRFPNLAKRVQYARAAESERVAWREQTENPDAVLDRWLEGFAAGMDAAIALSGIGDGSHLKALLDRLPMGALVFCAERDVAQFRRFLDSPLAETLLRDERVLFGVGELDDAFFSSLSNFAVLDIKSAEPLIFAPLFSDSEEYYERFFLEFARSIDVFRKLYGTSITKAGLWQRNSFANLPALLRSPDLFALFDTFRGMPLVMAGAGPSLDESLDFLRWAQKRAIIVAGNSSIRAMVNAGVRPHFVLAADPNPTTDRGFEGVDVGETVLVCPFLVYPSVVKRFEGRVASWGKGNVLATRFRKVLGDEKLAHVTEQGTVSACAFDLALMLGSSAIFFVGQDFAARTDGRLHASDSFYLDDSVDTVETDQCRWCPGNTIEKVPVEEKLFVYLKTFEQLARIYSKELKLADGKGMSVFNLSRLGAKVQHMSYLEFEKAKPVLESFRTGSIERGWKRARQILAGYRVDQSRVLMELEELKGYAENVCSFALKWALRLEMDAPEASKVSLEEVEAARLELESMLASRPEFSEILNDGQLKLELYSFQRARKKKYANRTELPPAEAMEVHAGHFWAFAEGAYHMLVSIESAMSKDTVDETASA